MAQQQAVFHAALQPRIPWFRQIRWNLILYSIMLVIVPVLTVGVFSIVQIRQQTINQATERLETVATLKHSVIENWLATSQLALDIYLTPNTYDLLANYVSVQDASVLQNFMNNTLRAGVEFNTEFDPLFTTYSIYNLQGVIVASSDEVEVGKVVSRLPYFEPSLRRNYIQAPYYTAGTNELVMYITRPLRNSFGRVVGAMAAKLDLTVLAQIMTEQTGLGETGENYLVSVENNYLLTPSRFGIDLNRAYRSTGIDRGLNGESGAGVYENYSQVPVIGVYRWLPELQAAFVVEINQAEALETFTRTALLSGAITVLAALAASVLALFVANRVARPISNLTQVAARIAAGNFNERAAVRDRNEVGLLARTFNAMSEHIQQLISGLEERVAARTRDLQTALDVNRQVSTILDTEPLLQAIADLTKERFNLYHAHIYLLNYSGTMLELAAGAGDTGRRMTAKGHAITLDNPQSIVARAARTREGVIINDVTLSSTFLPNPLLPDTRSEMAIPMVLAGAVVGVLDVQADTANRFSEDDQKIMGIVASQMAVAVENARAFRRVEEARDETERIYNLSTDMIGYAGFDGCFRNLNPAWERTLGWAPDELLGMKFIEFVHPADRQRTLDEYAAQISAGAPSIHFENRYLHKDGTYRWLSWNAVPYMEQQLTYFVTRDITERKAQEEQIAQLLDQTQLRLRDLEATNSIAELARSSGNIQSVLEQIMEQILNLMGADNGVISEYDYDTGMWQGIIGAGKGMTTDIARTFRDPGPRYPHGIEALRTGRVVPVNDTRTYPNFPQEYITIIGIKSVIVLPLFSGSTATGVIFLNYNEQYHTFTPEEMSLVQGLANQISTSMERKQAEQAILEAHEESETLYKVTTLINEAHTIQDVVDALVRHVVPAEAASVAVGTYLGGDITTATAYRILADWRRDGSTLSGVEIPLADFTASLPSEPTEIMHFDDVDSDPRLNDANRAAFQAFGVRGIVSIPMTIGGRAVGSLSVTTSEAYHFSARYIRILNAITDQVAIAVERFSLVQQTQKRAAELETVAQVGAAASTILDPEALLQEVADLTKARFSLYHAHIYLLDESGDNLVMTAGADEVGRRMKAGGHLIPLSRRKSLVVQAALTGEGVIVNDVTQDPNFLPNPLLPDTRSEMAVPLVVGGRVIGVLDVQSDQVNRFSDEDVRVQTVLADQIAVAVENARAYTEAERRAQLERESAERLREVDKLKSQFLANMSHELRTPLNSIIGYSEVLLDGVDGELTDEAQEDVEAIHNSGKHLLSIINEILDLAKIEAGEMHLDRKSIDLVSLATEVVKTGQVLVKDRPVTLDVLVDGDIPNVYADPVRLRQIIWNLFSNAVKFTEKGSVRILIDLADDYTARLAVQDTGMGMSESSLGVIFERFSQVDGSSTRRAGGTGLGLTITRQLVEMHGGTIEVTSVPGEGSTFWFTIPVHVPEVA